MQVGLGTLQCVDSTPQAGQHAAVLACSWCPPLPPPVQWPSPAPAAVCRAEWGSSMSKRPIALYECAEVRHSILPVQSQPRSSGNVHSQGAAAQHACTAAQDSSKQPSP